VFGFVFWVSVVSVWLFHMTFLMFVRIGFIYLLANYAMIYGIYGGVDELVLRRWELWNAATAARKTTTKAEERTSNDKSLVAAVQDV
jgi:hypothetical protein